MSATLNAPSAPARRSAWIPWVFVGGMLTVVAVNAVMVVLAVQSAPGLVVSKPFERGVRYNQVLAAQQKQDALGWSVAARFEPQDGPQRGQVVVTVTHGDTPLSVLSVTGALERPIEAAPSVPLAFTYLGEGRYAAPVAVPLPGQWELTATLRSGENSYRLIERLVVR